MYKHILWSVIVGASMLSVFSSYAMRTSAMRTKGSGGPALSDYDLYTMVQEGERYLKEENLVGFNGFLLLYHEHAEEILANIFTHRSQKSWYGYFMSQVEKEDPLALYVVGLLKYYEIMSNQCDKDTDIYGPRELFLSVNTLYFRSFKRMHPGACHMLSKIYREINTQKAETYARFAVWVR